MALHELAKEVREEELIRHLLLGKSVLQAAADMGFPYGTISRMTVKPDFKAKLRNRLERMYEELDLGLSSQKVLLQNKLKSEAENMVEEIISIAKTSAKDGVRLVAAKTALEMTEDLGFNRQQQQQTTVVLNAETIQIALQAEKELHKSQQETIEQALSDD